MIKKLLLIVFTLSIIYSNNIFAQAPEGFNYQCVIRDNSGQAIANQAVGVQFNILQGSITGSSVYTESHTTTTNGYGLITLTIGAGTTTDDLSTVDWGNGPYYIHVEADANGGTNYSDVSTTQMMSVPYALYAKYGEDADTDASNEIQDISLTGTDLSITSGSTVDLSSLQDGTGTDDQNIAGSGLNGTTLTIGIENGTSETVDLSSLQDGTGTDDQNIQGSSLSGTNLTIGIEGGTSETVDLSSLQDGTGTDDQNMQGSGLSGTDLTIGIENGTSETVDLSSLQDGTGTDDQNMQGSSLSGTDLTIGIENGTSETVDLSSLQDGTGTDDQVLTSAVLNGNNLDITIENGNTVSANVAALYNEDYDWLKAQSMMAWPNSIDDNIYRMGKVGIGTYNLTGKFKVDFYEANPGGGAAGHQTIEFRRLDPGLNGNTFGFTSISYNAEQPNSGGYSMFNLYNANWGTNENRYFGLSFDGESGLYIRKEYNGNYNGFVGIGTDSPLDKLHIEGDNYANSSLRFLNKASSNTDYWNLGVRDYAGNDEYFSIERNNSTGTGSTPFVVTDDGKVGINEVNPSQELDVNGNLRLRGALYDVNNDAGVSGEILKSTANGIDWIDGSIYMDNTDNQTLSLNSSNQLSISGGNSVNLSSLQDGTGTDNQNLTGASLTGTTLQINIENGTSTTVNLSSLISAETDPQVGSNSTNYVPKWNGSNLATGTIYDNGRIGIGSTSPNAKLHVNSSSTEDGFRVQINGSSKLYTLNNGGTGIGGNQTTLPNNGLYVFGWTGLGTNTPSARLDVLGNVRIQNTANDYALYSSAFSNNSHPIFRPETAWKGYLGTSSIPWYAVWAEDLYADNLGVWILYDTYDDLELINNIKADTLWDPELGHHVMKIRPNSMPSPVLVTDKGEDGVAHQGVSYKRMFGLLLGSIRQLDKETKQRDHRIVERDQLLANALGIDLQNGEIEKEISDEGFEKINKQRFEVYFSDEFVSKLIDDSEPFIQITPRTWYNKFIIEKVDKNGFTILVEYDNDDTNFEFNWRAYSKIKEKVDLNSLNSDVFIKDEIKISNNHPTIKYNR